MALHLRLTVYAACLSALAWCMPAVAQESLDVSAYCTFDGSAATDDVYVFGSSAQFREAVNRVLSVLEFPLELDLRAANVESISAARAGDQQFLLYNTYFAEGLAEDDWGAWTQLAHAVAHHVHRHSLDWTRERPLEEIEADQLAGSILYRLGVRLPELQAVADSIPEHPERPYPAPALRRTALTEGWMETDARHDDKVAFAGEDTDPPVVDLPDPPRFPPPNEGPDDDPRTDDIPPADEGPPDEAGVGTPDGGAPGDEPSSGTEYPMFWPPPQASVQTVVPLPILDSGEPATLGNVARQIEAALDETGYYERSYYAVPDGFAIVARIEQIHSDGTPLNPPERWAPEVRPMRRFSLTAYFKALFMSQPGHFRIVAFVVTSRSFTQQGEQIGRQEAQAWLDGGLNMLPSDIGAKPASARHVCTALIYSFEQPGRDFPLRFVDPSPIPARLHLQRAGLWSELQRVD